MCMGVVVPVSVLCMYVRVCESVAMERAELLSWKCICIPLAGLMMAAQAS